MLWMFQRTMQGPLARRLAEPDRCAVTSACGRRSWSRPLIALLLLLGFYPKPAPTDVINPAVSRR